MEGVTEVRYPELQAGEAAPNGRRGIGTHGAETYPEGISALSPGLRATLGSRP